MKDTLILSATRTPIGSFMGVFKNTPAPKLGAAAIRQAVRLAKVPEDQVDECLMGNVLPAGLGQAPARQAAIFAGLPHSVRCTTVNRVCGSGLKTVMFGNQMIQTEEASVVVAGGMENMSRAPFLLERAREGYRMGHGKIIDSMIVDGLWDVYNDFHMGEAAELCAREKGIPREIQDRFATNSYQKALRAVQEGLFRDEVVNVEITKKKDRILIEKDEDPFKVQLEKMGTLRPVFQKEGTVTAANASSLSDGAAAVVLAESSVAEKFGATPLAKIHAQASFAQAPEWFTTAPIGAVKKVIEKANLSIGEIDLFEINEAFSVMALACIEGLGISEEKVNVHGGAVALGHPLGASGARVLVTLLHALRLNRKKYGIATMCIGGGEASAMLVENLIL